MGDVEYKAGVKFKDILCSGIEAWSGNVEGVNISVSVIYGASNSRKTVDVNFLYGENREKSVEKGRVCDIYYANSLDQNDMRVRNLTQACSHEAGGHSAFGIFDAYEKASGIKGIRSVMGYGIQPIQPIDREMLIRSYKNNFEPYTKFQENLDLVKKYESI